MSGGQVTTSVTTQRVRCPSCAFPLEVTVTVCHVCGALVDPRVQFATWERDLAHPTRTS